MQGAVGLLNVVTVPPGATITSPRLVIDGVRGAIFVYQSGGPLGALIGSWAITAGTDPYGNVYPQGLNVSVGAISGGTITGVTITGSTITGTTFSGTNFIINSTGAFFYSSTPALGNLIASISNVAGTDAKGNAFIDGVAAYEIAPSPNIAVVMRLGTLQYFRATGPGGPFTEINGIDLANSPSTNLLIEQDLVVGSDLTVNRTFTIGGSFGAPPTPGALSTDIWADANSISNTLSILKSNTFAGRVGMAQVDITNNSNNNNTTAQAITKSWPLPASEFQANSTFSIECPFTATFEAQQLNIGYIQDGIFVNVVPIAAGAYAAGTSLIGVIRAIFIFTAGGGGGSMDVNFTGECSNAGANRAPGNTMTLNGRNGAQSYDCTVSHTMAIGARWQVATAGQIITGVDSILRREGI